MSAADLTLALGQPASHVAQGPGRGLPAHLTEGPAVLPGRAPRWVPRTHTHLGARRLSLQMEGPAWAPSAEKSLTLVSKPSCPPKAPRLP